ncbi:hypothetical protein BSKO_05805 [Bryopsis sp. KO-2023]|nr:hypothetical protein BSKO_05805 [Bryopsis sp. KO-2023]
MVGFTAKHVLCVVLVAAVILADVYSRFNNGAGANHDSNDDDDDDSDNEGFNIFDLFDRARSPSTGGPSTSPFQGPKRSVNISSDLREAVRSGDFNQVAALLNENNDVSGLAKGFRFSPQDRGMDLARTPERLRDGDVVTMKGVSKSGLDTGQARKLARIVAKSIFPGQGALSQDLEFDHYDDWTCTSILCRMIRFLSSQYTGALMASLLAMPEAEPFSVEPSDSRTEIPSSLKNMVEGPSVLAFFDDLKTTVHGFNLQEAWTIKPLLGGKEVMSVLEMERGGPELGKAMEHGMNWQLANPEGTKEQLAEYLKE